MSLDIEKNTFKGNHPTPKLKSYPEEGIIVLDEEYYSWLEFLSRLGIINLGNRSAIDWVLDQYKEKKIRDATIRDKFNIYRFRDYKTEVINLLKKIITISLQTMSIVSSMEEED